MQPLLAPPRDGLTPAQVRGLLTAPGKSVGFGAELVADDLTVLEDISADVESVSVRRNMNSAVHGGIALKVARELAWGRDRVRPYMTLTDGVVAARWNLGCYVLTTPDYPQGATPAVFEVSGFDLLYRLQRLIGDSYSVAAGTPVLQAVRDAVTASGVGVPVLLDSSAESATYSGRVWPYLPDQGSSGAGSDSSAASWLRVINDLLASVGYRGLWCDWDGRLRSEPYRAPGDRSVEWRFTVDDPTAGVVEADRTLSGDVWGAPNRWVFYRNGLDAAPVAGVSLYQRDNLDVGLSSQASVGVVPAAPQGLDAADYASLVAQGDRIADADMRVVQKITARLAPFPALWHADVAQWVDEAGARRVQGVEWEMPLDGSPVSVSWEVVS